MNKLVRPFVNYPLAAGSALLLILAFPGWNYYWLAPFALTPLLYALAHEPRPVHRFLLGYVAGNVYWFGVCYWIQFVLEVHGGMGRWGGWGTFLLFSLIKSLHMAVFAMLAAVVISRWYALPAVAALWTGIERTHGDLGFAWLCLGNAGVDLALPMRLAPWVGVYGLSFLFAMMAAGAALVAMKRPRKQLLWLMVIPALLLLPELPAPDPGERTAVLVQPNVPEELDWTPELVVRLHQMLLRRSLGTALHSQADLIVWPEAPAPIYYYRDAALQESLARLARLSKASLLIGTVADTAKREPLNSAVLIAPDGKLVDRYDKINLVPFGEYVPEFFSWVNRISQEAGDFVPGNRIVVFPFGDHKLGTFICYESAFPHEVREFVKGGANLLVNISNDGYFGHSGAREQHLEIVRMRAAENRRWLLRATNNGITANIDPAGRVVSSLPEFQEADGAFRYSLGSDVTAYTRLGRLVCVGLLADRDTGIVCVAVAALHAPQAVGSLQLTPVNNWKLELEVALAAAKAAGELALRYQHEIEVETKSDMSPVTHADRECEQLIASMLIEAFPNDGLLGEEGARRESKSGRKWIVDPIDGTRDYVRGNPLWATLIGLEVDGEIAAGVASLPALGGVYTASRGGGAFRNGEPIRVSAKTGPADAVLCFNGFNKINSFPFRSTLVDWMQSFWAVRSMGGAPDAMLIASGQADAWIEPVAAPWDLAPLKVIIEEAGGVFFNLDGGSTIYAGNCVACAPGLVTELKNFIGL